MISTLIAELDAALAAFDIPRVQRALAAIRASSTNDVDAVLALRIAVDARAVGLADVQRRARQSLGSFQRTRRGVDAYRRNIVGNSHAP